MLKIKNLKKYFGGVKAVNNCSFEVKKNTITALIGPNGAGKSTIFNLVSGILRTDSGQIIFDNKNITNLSVEKISNLGISRIFQQSHLFKNLKIKENLLLALDNKDTNFWRNLIGFEKTTKKQKEKIKAMLNLVDMEDFENTLAEELSYGQRRLIELTRAILNPHKFLMLDEPVSGVNPALRKKIGQILLSLKNKQETTLLIEHDMNFTLKIADRVVVMEKGKVIATGKPNEIKENPRVLKAYLGG